MTIQDWNDGFNAIDQADTFEFRLLGGQYGALVAAAGFNGGSVAVQAKAASGNHVAIVPAFTANGVGTAALPAGIYRVLFDFADASTTEADAATALADAETASADIIAISGSHPVSEALGQALVVAVQAIVDAIAAKLPGTAALALAAAQAASAAAQADATIAADASSMAALGDVDDALDTLEADVSAAPSGVSVSFAPVPTRRR